ncbi:CsgG/HfaB family protein [Lacinutrix salivirga]
MKYPNYKHSFANLFIVVFLTSCGAYFNQPFDQKEARIGETTKTTSILKSLPPAATPVEVAVYNFSDQTGQYKPVENGSTFSTAVTQGATTILIKALGDSGWFTPIERENLSNLSTERNIIRTTKQEYIKGLNPNEPPLPPLLYAGLMLEGGIISYDTNIITGGAGARYFGAGASTRYRQDRITIYLRAVSTSNGEILKTIYVSKTILSQAVDVSLFRFVKFQRLLEAETGYTRSEPIQLAVQDAIEKAVHDLIIEGIKDDYWSTKAGKIIDDQLVAAYDAEMEEANSTFIYDRLQYERRTKNALHGSLGASIINGDYVNAEPEFSGKIGYKRFLNPSFNINLGINKFSLSNKGLFNEGFSSFDVNLEYMVLPYDKLSPFGYVGGGSNVTDGFNKISPKVQAGLGLEYLITDKMGITLYAENNFVFSDNVDGLELGSRDDMYYRVGLGLNFYLGSNKSKFEKKKDAEREIRKKQNEIRKKNLEAILNKAEEKPQETTEPEESEPENDGNN